MFFVQKSEIFKTLDKRYIAPVGEHSMASEVLLDEHILFLETDKWVADGLAYTSGSHSSKKITYNSGHACG